jgi:hypothetical protein
MSDQPAALTPKARTDRLIVRQIEGEWLIYDLDNHKATYLNAFSARVFALCDGRRTPSDIVHALRPDAVEGDVVSLALEKLAKAKLLDVPSQAAVRSLASTSRRNVMRGIGAGAGALAMVPVVSAITMPSPAQAASGLPAGSSCSRFGGTPCCPGLTCRRPSPGAPRTCN